MTNVIKSATLLLLLTQQMVQAGFVQRLLDKKADDGSIEFNLVEFYGRVPPTRLDKDASEAYLTIMLSYEYATETIRFHFNMKEPAFKALSK